MMKKLWILPLAAIMMVACGEKEEEKKDGDANASASPAEYAEAKTVGLTDADINKAVEIGEKMQPCYTPESAPGAYDSSMDSDCAEEFMTEYESYCESTFGTADFHDEGEGGEKVDAFRMIMFKERNKK